MKTALETMLSTNVRAVTAAGASMMFWIWRYFISSMLHICVHVITYIVDTPGRRLDAHDKVSEMSRWPQKTVLSRAPRLLGIRLYLPRARSPV
jgi:hypothetical protein